MTDKTKKEISNILVQHVSGKDVDKVVDKISEIIDADLARVLVEVCDFGEIMRAVGLKIVGEDDPRSAIGNY